MADSGINLLQFINRIQCVVSSGNVRQEASNHFFMTVYSFWYVRQGLKVNPTHLALFMKINTQVFIWKYYKHSPTHTSWVGKQRLVPISDTMTPASPSYHAAPTQWAYCHTPDQAWGQTF